MSSPPLAFGLPPSLGWEPVKEIALRFANALYDIGFSSVVPFRRYEDLHAALLSGEIAAAWGPPLICAQVEAAGGRVALRALRSGSPTYCAALLCGAFDSLDLMHFATGSVRAGLKAGWVDTWSLAGYLLPREHIRSFGTSPEDVFSEQSLLGSYKACIRELLAGNVDVTATMAARPTLSDVNLFGAKPSQVKVLGFTKIVPHDGLVLSPQMPRDQVERLVATLGTLANQRLSGKTLHDVLRVEDFDVPEPGAYGPLLELGTA